MYSLGNYNQLHPSSPSHSEHFNEGTAKGALFWKNQKRVSDLGSMDFPV